ncbi:hypothetical protein NVS89_01060 [Ancylobacter sp. MQZ15Z-1]|uniref:Uncharacterized protein n=1 Tax=Ancylobacter mangrovi TaxID=2972472 RepID=A0A9X2PDQ3_9HYPH|nr:hypothetical protein [Ancylobacter mangrovi]MCS0493667.1 hypothetical protein [Ancylobacter mangrovi]
MKLPSIAALALVSLAVAGCVTETENKENMLSAAGFQVRMADTPTKVASLKSLPPHQFIVQNKDGQPVYIYADPTVCGCIYYGNQSNFQSYQQMVFQQQIVSQEQMTAMINQQAAFDFGAWGPMVVPVDVY